VAVRLRAAEILGAIGSEAALDALAGALADPEWMVRRAAVRALGEIPSPRVPGLLTPLQEDPDPRVRAPALRVLAGRGVGGALWALAEELAGPTAAKLVALDALRALADPSVVPEVGRTASDPDLEVAARAVETLAVTESGPALAHLFRALYDPRLGVSSVARAGLLRRTGSDPGARPGAWRRWGEARGLAPPD
jgi:HEAT repeat protein